MPNIRKVLSILEPNTRKVLAIVGLAGAAGLGLYALSRASASQGCTSNSDCPPGQICQNGQCINQPSGCTTNLDCNPGEICLNGQCVTVGKSVNCQCDPSTGYCPPGIICDCSTCWDQINAACSPLIPYQILGPFIGSGNAYFFILYDCTKGLITNWGATTENTCVPPNPQGSYSSTVVVTPFTITVVDSAGHPICNQPVNLSLVVTQTGGTSVNWKTADGVFVGTLNYGLAYGSTQATDDNGNIVVYVSVTMEIDFANSHPQWCFFCCGNQYSDCNYTYYDAPTNLTIQYALEGNPNIRGVSQAVITTSICGAYC